MAGGRPGFRKISRKKNIFGSHIACLESNIFLFSCDDDPIRQAAVARNYNPSSLKGYGESTSCVCLICLNLQEGMSQAMFEGWCIPFLLLPSPRVLSMVKLLQDNIQTSAPEKLLSSHVFHGKLHN